MTNSFSVSDLQTLIKGRDDVEMRLDQYLWGGGGSVTGFCSVLDWITMGYKVHSEAKKGTC